MRQLLVWLNLSLIGIAGLAQYPTDYFRSPVDFPIYLAGSFAELRGGHFHSGIDIKTGGEVGQEIFAIADGYVSRIKISPYGFGKTIYIAHPNGYTSVYAHLLEFSEPMASYFEEMQYLKETYALDLYITPGKIKVSKGQVIALSGNSGSSSGPHLHFEIRNSATQKPINPQLFGIEVNDNIAPSVWWLYSYTSAGGRHPVPHEVMRNSPNFRLSKPDNTLQLPTGEVAFAAKVVDRMNGSGSHLDIYDARLEVDGQVVYELKTETFSFSETRYLNAHIDYYLQEAKGTRVHRLHRLPGDHLSMYRNLVNDGWISLGEGEVKEVEAVLTDASGNTTRLVFNIEGVTPREKKTTLTGGKKMKPGASYVFQEGEFSISIPSTALYDTIYFQFGLDTTSRIEKKMSPVFKVHNTTTPLHSRASVRMRVEDYPRELRNQTVARRELNPGDYDFYEGSWSGNTFSFRTRDFGNYHLSADTTAPEIRPRDFYNGQTLSPGRLITISIRDEESGINDYDVYLDGNWLLMEYDFKEDRLFGKLPADFQPGDHKLKVRVTDDVNNISEKTYKIKIKP